MPTADERLTQLEAFVDKIAAFKRGGIIHMEDRQLIEHDEMIGEARTLVKQRLATDPRFDKVLSVLRHNEQWLMPEDSARRFVRDVLAALDA